MELEDEVESKDIEFNEFYPAVGPKEDKNTTQVIKIKQNAISAKIDDNQRKNIVRSSGRENSAK